MVLAPERAVPPASGEPVAVDLEALLKSASLKQHRLAVAVCQHCPRSLVSAWGLWP